jgi:hypothetical protein
MRRLLLVAAMGVFLSCQRRKVFRALLGEDPLTRREGSRCLPLWLAQGFCDQQGFDSVAPTRFRGEAVGFDDRVALVNFL